jgi:alpha-tubulin suppressor-like RCC1 family protein
MGDSTFISKLVPSTAASGRAFVTIAAGVHTACALDHDGAAWCWGDDPTQPGVPVSVKNVAIPIHADRAFTSIAVGNKFACALDADGSAYCWGENGRGQLGVGDTLPHASPTRTGGGLRFTSITSGFWHTCALTSAGAAYCWGDNQYGELGTGDTTSSSVPRRVSGSTPFRSLGAGPIHQCGVSVTGLGLCWGSNFSGQLGDGTVLQRTTPVPIATSLMFTTIRGGRANSIFGHSCGIVVGGDVFCWGYDSKGQIGNAGASNACVPFQAPGTRGGDTTVKFQCTYAPVRVGGVSNAVALDVGQEHSCALTTLGQIYCWGENAHGELGDGTGVAQATPVAVKGGLTFP